MKQEWLEIYSSLVKQIEPDYKRPLEVSRKILCVSPHPDDCEIGAGGTIARATKSGVKVDLVVVTDGSKGTLNPHAREEEVASTRRREQEESAKVLGVENIYFLGVRDGELTFNYDVLNKLITIIRITRPDLVLTPDPYLPYEAHPDHYYTGRLVSAAVLFSGMPLFNKQDLEKGLTPHSPRFIGYYYTSRPNTIVDVSNYVEYKISALRKHRSQFENEDFLLFILKYMELSGSKIGVKYAEEFKILPVKLLHITPFIEYL